MKVYTGNIWNLHHDHWLVIPTNAGWNSHGENVMGAGLAKQAAAKFPTLPTRYGHICRGVPNGSAFWADSEDRLILFPVKPLTDVPHLSWKQPASLRLIQESATILADWIGQFESSPLIAIPVVGCGNGQLDPSDVLPVLAEHLSKFENVVLVRL